MRRPADSKVLGTWKIYFLAFGNSRGGCSLVFGCYIIACFCMLSFSLVYKEYVLAQGHSTAYLFALIRFAPFIF